MDKTKLGDRMKQYERREQVIFSPYLPLVARMDGRCFSNLSKCLKLARPYCKRFSDCMQNTTMQLVERTGASCGYTQSDEITLCWKPEDRVNHMYFGGKSQKAASCLASETTAIFLNFFWRRFPNHRNIFPTFDARVWQVPTEMEAANVFLWREQDATRNSVQMSARSLYSHKECHNKNNSELQEMIFQKGVNWNNYPDFFKRGSYFIRTKVRRRFTKEEIKNLPEKHEAHNNPNFVVERQQIRRVCIPPLGKVFNKDQFVVYGKEPQFIIGDV